jgi:glycosyltransferase involved in cell wall biosynthesis
MGRSTYTPSVSIITPAYNSASYLPETIASVLAQTFSDFELLIIDDGSRDDTLQVALDFAARDTRIRVLPAPNAGPAAARNCGMAEARGDFFALLDSDDIWRPQYLARQLAALERFPDAASVTANAINLGGPRDGTPLWPRTSGMRRLGLRDVLREEDAISILSVFRRAAFETVGGFDAAFTGNEDYHFWIKLLISGFVVLQQAEPLGFYRRREGSVSADERRMIEGIIRVLLWTRNYCQAPADLDLIDRQLARFDRDLRLVVAKDHLIRREFHQAAEEFAAVSRIKGDLFSSLVAHTSRQAPVMLRWAYQTLTAFRTSRVESRS